MRVIADHPIKVLVLDGHPQAGRLMGDLLDGYAKALPHGTAVERTPCGTRFDPNLRAGYAADQPWEPDLQRVGDAVAACDHLVVGFPLWWGGEPAMLKGLLDRLLLPGFAMRYHQADIFWDRLLAGRSAELVITADTPPWYLRAVYGDPVGRRWRRQVLGFCGFDPIRIHRLGPTRRGEAGKRFAGWQSQLASAAAAAPGLRRGVKRDLPAARGGFAAAVADRRS